jgi:acetolactate synthase-1/2/3 large subunit
MVDPYLFMEELSKQSKDGDIIITDAGQTLVWTMQAYKIRKKVRLFSAFNHSAMGYALPASIGAKIASPDSRVICIIGDGGMQMNVQELETIVFNKLNIHIFMLNNQGYGMIRQTQDDWMKSNYVAVDETSKLGFPSMRRIAVAYGLRLSILSEDSWSKDIIIDDLSSDKPTFCDVKIDPKEKIRHKLLFGKKLEEIT